MIKKIFFLIFFFFSFLSVIYSNNYYADIEILVEENGFVYIDGITNFEKFKNFSSSSYTYKNGENWLLNISFDDFFDYYIYELTMPENSIINYIKTTPNLRFETINNRIVLIGTGEKQKFEIIIQYKLNNNNQEESFNYYYLILFFLIIVVVVFIIFYFKYKIKFKKIRKSLNKDITPVNNEKNNLLIDKIEINLDDEFLEKYNLNFRQKEILKIILEKNEITQKDLEKILKIPKSSLSRNINSLINKNLINKKSLGGTNLLFLKNK